MQNYMSFFSKKHPVSLFSIRLAAVSDVIALNPFLRYVSVENVEVSNLPDNGVMDLYPPAKVTDLLVISINHMKREVLVQFSVTGDDMLDGQGNID